MRVAFVGGGTGGHLVPGIAVAERLVDHGHDVCFAIAGRDVERALLDPRGLEHHALFDGGQGRPAPWRLDVWLRAWSRWRALERRFDPHVTVVLGGWVALPIVFARRGVSVLLEQNASPGKVQRALSGRVDHACLAYPGADMPTGRVSTTVTGNPLRTLPRVERAEACARLGLDIARKTLLVMGGSQGAADVNRLVPSLLVVLAERAEAWQILHLTGHAAHGVEAVQDGSVPIVRRAFVDTMADAYAASDVAVCRSGAITVAELAATGTPALLVPYPYHDDDHQRANAAPLVEAGGAVTVPYDDPRGVESAPPLLRDVLARLAAMSLAARTVAHDDATDVVTNIIEDAAARARGLQR